MTVFDDMTAFYMNSFGKPLSFPQSGTKALSPAAVDPVLPSMCSSLFQSNGPCKRLQGATGNG
jgi:hypothetical protein